MLSKEQWDNIFAIGSLMLAIALLPAVIKDQPPAPETCILTAFVLYAFGGGYFDLRMHRAAILTTITALLWTVMLVQGLA